jgi:hypothetical protein
LLRMVGDHASGCPIRCQPIGTLRLMLAHVSPY